MEDGVDASDRAHGQRLAIVAPVGAQAFVEGIHHYRGEVADKQVTKTGLEMALDDRLQVAHGRRRPSRATPGEPQIEQLAHRRARSNSRSNVGVSCKGLEFST